MNLLITGATGLTGSLFLQHLSKVSPHTEVCCLVRPTSDRPRLRELDLRLDFCVGDSSSEQTWQAIFRDRAPQTVIHLAQLRHVPALLAGLRTAGEHSPRLIIIGTTGIYSKYNEYAQAYRAAEAQLEQYWGSYCLLRPTMIYGFPRDKNLHKLIRFCDRYGFFFVFGSGENLLQPLHADDLAQALLSVYQHRDLTGAYDLSGGSIVSFRQLLGLVSQHLGKPVRQLSFPLNFGIWSATLLENWLKARSPVRREQILRLQEDKIYSHAAAQRDFGFSPRSLEIGLQQEIALMREQGLLSS